MAARTIEVIFRFLDLFVLGFIRKLVITKKLHQNAVTKSTPPPPLCRHMGNVLHPELFPKQL